MAFTCPDNTTEWWHGLVADGIVPPGVRRIVIDMAVCDVVKVYYECNADERMLNVGLTDIVKNSVIRSVNEVDDGQSR